MALTQAAVALSPQPAGDLERFRLRRFVSELIDAGEAEVHDAPIALGELGHVLDGNPKAVLFHDVGPERTEVVGNVMGSRKRLAMAFGVGERALLPTMVSRLGTPQAPVEIASSQAPVHQEVLTGEDADFRRLPIHLQHGLDGAPYISATLDFSHDPHSGGQNVGVRRLMLRGRREAGIDLNAPSDLRAHYMRASQAGKKLPLSIAIGGHPCDFLGALCAMPPMDETAILGALRASPVPLVRCITNELLVPADAEIVLEGYLDELGWHAPEGPYGEYLGYYGKLKMNPVFHLTAITKRHDALFQTATIGGRHVAMTDTAQLGSLKTEQAIWIALQTAVREPIAVHATAASGGMYNARVSLRQRVPGEARNAIAAVLGSTGDVKHVFVVDPDVDVFSHEQLEWALATRFQADRDLVVASGFRAVPLDPSLQGQRAGAKVGFDLTMPFGAAQSMEYAIPEPPTFAASERRSVREALKIGPKTYLELMNAAGTTDGRELLVELEALYASKTLHRLDDGRYCLKDEG
jgi:UbiD family decarboxylase